MQGGGGGAGHRLTLWKVPEACNLLRHLKNINRNLSLEGTAYPSDRDRGREGSPWEIREGYGLFQGGNYDVLGISW